jgi:hypothetical protein
VTVAAEVMMQPATISGAGASSILELIGADPFLFPRPQARATSSRPTPRTNSRSKRPSTPPAKRPLSIPSSEPHRPPRATPPGQHRAPSTLSETGQSYPPGPHRAYGPVTNGSNLKPAVRLPGTAPASLTPWAESVVGSFTAATADGLVSRRTPTGQASASIVNVTTAPPAKIAYLNSAIHNGANV